MWTKMVTSCSTTRGIFPPPPPRYYLCILHSYCSKSVNHTSSLSVRMYVGDTQTQNANKHIHRKHSHLTCDKMVVTGMLCSKGLLWALLPAATCPPAPISLQVIPLGQEPLIGCYLSKEGGCHGSVICNKPLLLCSGSTYISLYV